MIDLHVPIGTGEPERKDALVNVMTFVFNKMVDGVQKRMYQDYACNEIDTAKNDYFFVRAGLRAFLTKHPGYAKYFIVTDGCAKQFACRFFEKVRLFLDTCWSRSGPHNLRMLCGSCWPTFRKSSMS